MADVYPMQFKGDDREPFAEWLTRCKKLGVAATMTDAMRLAVRLAQTQTDEQIKNGSGKCTTSCG